MGVSTRHTRRILAAYREEGAAALSHGNRGLRATNATPETAKAEVLRLARSRYSETNHTHLSELLREREGNRHRSDQPFGARLLAAMRNRFDSGHAVRSAG